MAKQIKKNEGISCACGKTDLYEEWLKNENIKKEASDSSGSETSKESKNNADSSDKK